MSEYEEADRFQICGFNCHGTACDQREILARLRASPKWLRWAVLDYQVQQGTFRAASPEGQKLCEDLASADVAMSRVANRLIHEVLREIAG